MNTLKLEEIINYQEKTLNFLKLELEKAVEADKAQEMPEDLFDREKIGDDINDKV